MASFLFLLNCFHLGVVILGLLSAELLQVLTNISGLRGWSVTPLATTHLPLVTYKRIEAALSRIPRFCFKLWPLGSNSSHLGYKTTRRDEPSNFEVHMAFV